MPRNEFTCDCNAINHEIVEYTLSKMPDESIFSKLSSFYKIIGDPTRCKILYALELREMCVCDLANVLSMTKSSISHQLHKMKECGVLKCRREGKEVYYSPDDAHIVDIFRLSLEHVHHK